MTSIDIVRMTESLRNGVYSMITLEPMDADCYLVHTGFTLPDGNELHLVLKEKHGRWIITDEAHTLMWLSYEDLYISESHRKMLDLILSSNSVSFDDGRMYIDCTGRDAGQCLVSMVRAVLRTADLLYPDSDNVQRVLDSIGDAGKTVLYAISSSSAQINDSVTLQKVVFLCCRSMPDILGESFRFEAGEEGPYCSDIDRIVLNLIRSGLLDSRELTLSDTGEDVYEAVSELIGEPLRSTIDYWKEFQKGLTEYELLTFVYSTYPDSVHDSEVIDGIKRNIRKNTVSLVATNKISVGRGSEMLGLDYAQFEDLLRGEGMRWRS